MSDQIYDHQKIETKWQQVWEEQKLFQDSAKNAVDPAKKLYLLFAFAYPSGSGLHVGHVESKTALDILARFYRMQGKDVFFPVGWDAFGLPAENYAIKTGVPPAVTTAKAIATFQKQLKRIGISYDWTNEITTCKPDYYRWTQWLFLELFQAGLAYQAEGKVNWCPGCQTVLANEQVVSGLCERCGSEVIQKEMKQWYFKITQYQDELIEGLAGVDWPKPTKLQQINWIGRSEGVKIDFAIEGSSGGQKITCFTTRLDTIFGVSFIALSPEKFTQLNLVENLAEESKKSVGEYINQASKKTEEERKIGEKKKTGVDTGLKAINPVNGREIPVWVADYVLVGYGTGAVMGVPAHDSRDKEFATKFDLEITKVIEAKTVTAYGTLVNSGKYDGLSSEAAIAKILNDFPEVMVKTKNYKLRDWLISRQRYWGAPIPIIYDPAGQPHPIMAQNLPWMLPEDVDFKPSGESPLKSSLEFLARTEKYARDNFAQLIAEKGWDKTGQGWIPEYDTMDTFVDSSWYYLRYADTRNNQEFASKKRLQQWLPVDFYMIGPEHIVLHLLYSRFFTKFLADQGYLKFKEPFLKMRHQGMILGPDGKKMSKSKGNTINPDDIVEKFGADTLRVYEMFMGPIEADKPWDDHSVVGVHRFLRRIYKMVKLEKDYQDDYASNLDVERQLHKTIKKVSTDIPELKFNTAIASMMELVNVWESKLTSKDGFLQNEKAPHILNKRSLVNFLKILAPFAPFMTAELFWKMSEIGGIIHLTEWPDYNPDLTQDELKTIPVQVNGKLRGELVIGAQELKSLSKEEIFRRARALAKIAKWLDGKQVKKEIYVPGRIVNLVV